MKELLEKNKLEFIQTVISKTDTYWCKNEHTGLIDVHGSVQILGNAGEYLIDGELPVGFGCVEEFYVQWDDFFTFKSFKGFPIVVTGDCKIAKTPSSGVLNWMPKYIGGEFSFNLNEFDDVAYRTIREIDEIIRSGALQKINEKYLKQRGGFLIMKDIKNINGYELCDILINGHYYSDEILGVALREIKNRMCY